MSDAIRVRDLVKTYPGRPAVEAVRGIALGVRVGECFGLLGPNGAGKTTTLEILEPDRTALVCEGVEYTYLELDWLANRMAWRLHSEGVAAGDKVGVLPRPLLTSANGY